MSGQLIFEYEGFEKETRSKLKELSKLINNTANSHIQKMMELGALISEANEILAKVGRDSMFGAWIESECSISRRTAYNWMAAYDRFGAHPEKLANLTAEAIYYLSGSVDLHSVDLVLEAAEQEKIGIERAKEIVQGLHSFRPESVSGGASTTQGDPPDLDDECDKSAPVDVDRAPYGQGKGADSGQNNAKEIADEIDSLLTALVWKLDEFNTVLPQDRLHQSALDSIDLASREINLWKQMIRE
jgi:hypothetical protein